MSGSQRRGPLPASSAPQTPGKGGGSGAALPGPSSTPQVTARYQVEAACLDGWWLVRDTHTGQRAGTTKRRRAWQDHTTAAAVAARLEHAHRKTQRLTNQRTRIHDRAVGGR